MAGASNTVTGNPFLSSACSSSPSPQSTINSGKMTLDSPTHTNNVESRMQSIPVAAEAKGVAVRQRYPSHLPQSSFSESKSGAVDTPRAVAGVQSLRFRMSL
jgi:hypothetical protein